MLKKSDLARFPRLSDPMHGISRNKETFSVEFLEDTHTGKKRWGLVYYGVKYNLLAYYRLGSKDPTAVSTLYTLSQFIAEHRNPRMIITDSNGVLGAGMKWKHFLRQIFTPLQLYEPVEHNQNPFKYTIQNFKAGLGKIRNDCSTGGYLHTIGSPWSTYLVLMITFPRQAIGKWLSVEAFWGETPDISIIRFKFWYPLYYRNWSDKAGKVLMHHGRFVGFA